MSYRAEHSHKLTRTNSEGLAHQKVAGIDHRSHVERISGGATLHEPSGRFSRAHKQNHDRRHSCALATNDIRHRRSFDSTRHNVSMSVGLDYLQL